MVLYTYAISMSRMDSLSQNDLASERRESSSTGRFTDGAHVDSSRWI